MKSKQLAEIAEISALWGGVVLAGVVVAPFVLSYMGYKKVRECFDKEYRLSNEADRKAVDPLYASEESEKWARTYDHS